MKELGSIWESVLLAGFGIYLISLATGGEYWRLMNPKFMYLTLTCGVVLAVLGLGALATARRRPVSWSRVALFTVLGGLILVFEGSAVPGSEAAFQGQQQTQAVASPLLDQEGPRAHQNHHRRSLDAAAEKTGRQDIGPPGAAGPGKALQQPGSGVQIRHQPG